MTHEQPSIIGVTCSDVQTDSRPKRLGQNVSYLDALTGAGAAPVLVPNLGDLELLRAVYERLDGLLLSGGVDIHPSYYGEPIHEKCGQISSERDETELPLTRWAIQDGKPVLAICRGIQVLNVALGGSLYQDIEAQVPGAEKHDWHATPSRDHLAHSVTVAPETRLAGILSVTYLPVNSMHHQAIKDVAPGLAVVARAPDGIIEAVEAPDHPFALGVQWHPEELATTDAHAQHLFEALVAACHT
jgi:putative glutamine amidotransferase